MAPLCALDINRNSNEGSEYYKSLVTTAHVTACQQTDWNAGSCNRTLCCCSVIINAVANHSSKVLAARNTAGKGLSDCLMSAQPAEPGDLGGSWLWSHEFSLVWDSRMNRDGAAFVSAKCERVMGN